MKPITMKQRHNNTAFVMYYCSSLQSTPVDCLMKYNHL